MSETSISQFFDQLGVVRILSASVQITKMNRKDGSGQYDAKSQQAVYFYYLNGQLCSQPVEFRLGRDDAGYEPGDYSIAGGAFGRGKWGNLALDYNVPLVRIPEGLLRLLEQDRQRIQKVA